MTRKNNISDNQVLPYLNRDDKDLEKKIFKLKHWLIQNQYVISKHKLPILQALVKYMSSTRFLNGESHAERYILISEIIKRISLSDVLFLKETLNLLNKANDNHFKRLKEEADARKKAQQHSPHLNTDIRISYTTCGLSILITPKILQQQKLILLEITKPLLVFLSAYFIKDTFVEPQNNLMFTVPFYGALLLTTALLVYFHEKSFKHFTQPINFAHRFVACATPFCLPPNEKNHSFNTTSITHEKPIQPL